MSGKFESTSKDPYNDTEKAYLRERWGGESHFLPDFGLSIDNEGQRAMGRAIIRELMTYAEDCLCGGLEKHKTALSKEVQSTSEPKKDTSSKAGTKKFIEFTIGLQVEIVKISSKVGRDEEQT